MSKELVLKKVEGKILSHLYPYRFLLAKQPKKYPAEISKNYMKSKGMLGTRNQNYIKNLEQRGLVVEKNEKLSPDGRNSRYVKNLKRRYIILLITSKGVAIVERLKSGEKQITRKKRGRKKEVTDLLYLVLVHIRAKEDGAMLRKEISDVLDLNHKKTNYIINALVDEKLVTKEKILENSPLIFKITSKGRKMAEE